MDNKLEKKYGLTTAICMVVGIVIGSGVFFKAEAVLNKTEGNMPLGILAWLIVGLVMIACSYVFATMATKYEKVNGLVDYAEATIGNRYAYNIGWFTATIYAPCLVSVLAWVSARYVCVLLNWDITGGACMTIAGSFLCIDYALNAISPKIAGKFQVSTTVVKMIPLILMAIVGTFIGIKNGQMTENFAVIKDINSSSGGNLMAAAVSVAFAYEGWILTTSINAELKDSKKNLPIALVVGSFVVVVTYIVYYIGINGVITPSELMASGETAVKIAFQRLFGETAGAFIFVLVVISCLGTLNGLMLSGCRTMYALASRNEGPSPELFKQVDSATNMPNNSAVISLALDSLWLLYFFGANLDGGWFGSFNFDSSELPVVTMYAMYIPIFIQFMRKANDLNGFKRFVMPVLGTIGCLFMIYAAFAAYGVDKVFHYLIVFAIIMFIGNLLYKRKKIKL